MGYTDQKSRIKAMEDQITLLSHEKSVAISKLQLANSSGMSPMRNSFRNSVVSNSGKQEAIIKVKKAPREQEETTGNMQGESGNHASNNQEKEEEYPEAEVEVEVQEMDDEDSPKNEFGALEDEF